MSLLFIEKCMLIEGHKVKNETLYSVSYMFNVRN